METKVNETASIERGPRFEAWAARVEARMQEHDWDGIEHEAAMDQIDHLIERIEKEQARDEGQQTRNLAPESLGGATGNR